MSRKIDDTVLLDMMKEGREQKEAAAYFHVTPAAICKRLKRLQSGPEAILDKYDLTDRERAFCMEKAKGKTNTQAALASYEVTSTQSAKVIGSQLMGKPEIQDAARELQECGLTTRYRVNRIKSHVDHRDPNVSLKALDMSFKLDGSYAPEKHEEVSFSVIVQEAVEQCDEALMELQRLIETLGIAQTDKPALCEDSLQNGKVLYPETSRLPLPPNPQPTKEGAPQKKDQEP
jgi:hypothetical protein